MMRSVLMLVMVGCLVAWGEGSVFRAALAKLSKQEQAIANQLRDVFRLMAGVSNVEAQAGVRSRGLLSTFNQFCDCGGSNCGCCGQTETMGVTMNTCVNVTVIPEEYAFEVKTRMGFFDVFKTKISAKKLERVCTKLPALNNVNICLTSKMAKVEGDGFKSCMQLDLDGYGLSLAQVKFKCMKYQNGVLTAEEYEADDEKDPAFVIDSPNPIEALINFIKNIKNNQ